MTMEQSADALLADFGRRRQKMRRGRVRYPARPTSPHQPSPVWEGDCDCVEMRPEGTLPTVGRKSPWW